MADDGSGGLGSASSATGSTSGGAGGAVAGLGKKDNGENLIGETRPRCLLRIVAPIRPVSTGSKRLPLSPTTSASRSAVKIGLIGDPGVGKTSLMVRYVEKRFDQDYVETLGEPCGFMGARLLCCARLPQASTRLRVPITAFPYPTRRSKLPGEANRLAAGAGHHEHLGFRRCVGAAVGLAVVAGLLSGTGRLTPLRVRGRLTPPRMLRPPLAVPGQRTLFQAIALT
jgi:hypothetical protein